MHEDTLKAVISEVKSMQQEFCGHCERLIAFLEQELRDNTSHRTIGASASADTLRKRDERLLRRPYVSPWEMIPTPEPNKPLPQ